jgi:hypothetical protein
MYRYELLQVVVSNHGQYFDVHCFRLDAFDRTSFAFGLSNMRSSEFESPSSKVLLYHTSQETPHSRNFLFSFYIARPGKKHACFPETRLLQVTFISSAIQVTQIDL